MTRWSNDKVFFFISLYRQHECLWNIRSQDYKNKALRAEAYERIAELMDDPNLKIRDVKNKIKNYRSMYHLELRKIKDSSTCGVPGYQYKPNVVWFEQVDAFLKDVLDDQETSSPTDIILEDQDSFDEHQNNPLNNDVTLEYMNEEEEDPAWRSDLEEVEPVISTLTSTTTMSHNTSYERTKTRRKRQNDESILNAFKHLDRMSSDLKAIKKQTVDIVDDYHVFALSVAAQLRKLPLRSAIHTQSKIQSILSQARINSLIARSQNY